MSANKNFKSFEIYEVSEEYINYLRKYDSKVEKSEGLCYQKKRKYLGVVLGYGKKYLIPFSSPKNNDYINGEPRRSNTTIIRITTSEMGTPTKVIGKLKTSSMIPINDMRVVTHYNILEEKYKQYGELIRKQIEFIKENSTFIENCANRIYYEKTNNFTKEYIKSTVDFKILEKAAMDYLKSKDSTISKSIQIYREQLENGYIQEAYLKLMKYISELKTKFSKEYKTGNISFGYLDYTYFPFFNEYLRESKLRFGIVLNHKKMQFELWLMGQNASIQQKYWDILKNTKWNKGIDVIPKHYILEVCLANNVNFDNKEKMTISILKRARSLSKEIQSYLENQKL